MSIDEQIAVMQAYKEGKKIEWKYNNEIYGWSEVQDPAWNWRDLDYRVKPEIRPYTKEELLTAIREHGPMVRYSEDYYPSITDINLREPANVTLGGERYLSFEELTLITWQDGTPCGVEEKEQ